MTQVEHTAVWPTQLLDVLMVMIPKKGEDSVPKVMKTRLIAITSHLYRTWATCRAQWLQRFWIPDAIAHQVFGGRKGLGTGDAVLYESTSWDLAASGHERWACAYFDASKCFDSFKYRDLVRVGERLGIPGPLLGALESFYSNHRRHYLVRSWMTSIGSVKRGIPQGCPLSCVMAMAWAHTWIHVVQSFVTNAGLTVSLHQSAYLDDLCLACNDAEILERLAGVTSAHFESWGVRLNLDKSAFVANARICDSERFGSLATLIRADSQLLLGAATGWVPAKDQLRLRCDLAQKKLRRLASVNLNKKVLERAVQVWIAPLLYASGLGPLFSLRDSLTKDIVRLLWGKARVQANIAAVMACSIPSHSVVPLGVQIMKLALRFTGWLLALQRVRFL